MSCASTSLTPYRPSRENPLGGTTGSRRPWRLFNTHDVRWLNLHPDDAQSAKTLGQLEDCDFLLVKRADPALVARLQAGGIELIDFVDYRCWPAAVAGQSMCWCRVRSRRRERSVLEGRACGALVHVAEDNPKLLQLAALPTVWDEHYYGRQLLDGMERASAPAPRRLISYLGL